MTQTVPRIPPVGTPISVTHERRGSSIRVRLRWTVNGQQTGVSKTFQRSPDREQRMAEFVESVRMSKRERLVPRLTVNDFVVKVGEQTLFEHLAPTTEATYRSALQRQLLPFLGHTEVTELNERRVRQFARSIEGDSSRRNALALLSRLCKVAVDLGYLPRNPVSSAEVRRNTQGSRQGDRFILTSAEQEAVLFDTIGATSVIYRDALRVTLDCALRIGEACGLAAGDYDSRTHLIKIERQVDGSSRVRPPKWGSVRKVPVGRTAHDLIEQYSEGKQVGEPLFGQRGGWMSSSSLRSRLDWNNMVEGIGLDGFRLHDLRHTGLTRLCRRLAAAGEPITLIKDIAGHRSIRTTESYIHTSADDMSRAAAHLWD